MPRNSKRRRKEQRRNPPADMVGIEEQLRLQRLASSNKRVDKVQDPPPAELGGYVYDAERNTYFPRSVYEQEKLNAAPVAVDPLPYIALSRRVPSFLQAAESCSRPAERRHLLKEWRSEKSFQRLAVSSMFPDDSSADNQPNERRGVPLWWSSFAVNILKSSDESMDFSHVRLADNGLDVVEQNRTLLSCGKIQSGLAASGHGQISSMKTKRSEMTVTTGTLFHKPDENSSSYVVCMSFSRVHDRRIVFGEIPGHLEDYCFLDDNTTMVFGAGRCPRKNMVLFRDNCDFHEARMEGRAVSSEILCLENAPWAPTVAVAGHRDGHISWLDRRCQSVITFRPSDMEFGNIVGLHTSSTAVMAQGASGRCRLFDVRKPLLHEFCPPAKPRWMRTSDCVCKGFAVDPTNSVVLLPQAQQEGNTRGTLSMGVWSLLTGVYLGERGCFASHYLELSPFVTKSVLSATRRQGRPAAMSCWADLGTHGLAEIQFDR